MSSAIQNLLENTLGDLARSAKYELVFSFTDTKVALTETDIVVMGKTASFPGKSHRTIDFKYKGRIIPIKGQVKYQQTWDCTFHLTEDHMLKKLFEDWIEALDQKHNYPDTGTAKGISKLQATHDKTGYTTTIHMYQKDFYDDLSRAKYAIFNAFPIAVSQVQTSYEATAQVQEFTVTFAYSHYLVENFKGKDGNFIDELAGKLESYAANAITGAMSAIGTKVNSLATDALGSNLKQLNDWSAGLSTKPDFINKAAGTASTETSGAGKASMASAMHNGA